jgi:hypothetical protein
VTNPYLFIVGAARSGTTLLQRVVNAHPEIAVVNETYWLPRKFSESAGLTPEGLVTPGLIPMLLENPKFTRMGFGGEELKQLLDSNDPISYPAFVSRMFDLYAEAQGKRIAGDKSPGYVRKMHVLHRLWPEAKFVHLIRDGRDLCLSMMDWKKGERVAGALGTWAEDPVTTIALYWKRSMMLGWETGTTLGPGLYYEIRYESLVASPAAECRALCDFLGVPFDGIMLQFHEGRTRQGPHLSSKAKWLPPTPGLRDWRTQMLPRDAELFEAVAGDLLVELCYPRAFPRISTEAGQQAARIEDVFTREARRRGRHLPIRW